MNTLLAVALLASTPAAPVPKETPPNPLGWAYMGVTLTSTAASAPLRIDAPAEGTPASKAGLRAGDELLRVGAVEPITFDDVIRHVLELRPGTVIRVDVRRAGAVKRLRLTLGERPSDGAYTTPDFLRKLNPMLPDDDD